MRWLPDACGWSPAGWDRPLSFVVALVLGQALALLVTATGATSQSLTTFYGVSVPTTQSLLVYLLLISYAIPLARSGGLMPVLSSPKRLGGYLLVAIADVEANFLVVKAYNYTSLTSVMLLDCFTIPVVMALAAMFLGTRFGRLHVSGVAACLAGIVALVLADYSSKSAREADSAADMLYGDLLVLGGATLYAVSNVAQEFVVKSGDDARIEFLGMLGLLGAPVSGLQVALLESSELMRLEWRYEVVLLIGGFSMALFTFYSLAPVLVRATSATFLNLSLLTADVYGLVVAIFLFAFSPSVMFVFSFFAIIFGIVVYNYHPPKDALQLPSPVTPAATPAASPAASPRGSVVLSASLPV
ncbi:solute carrier family 35 [Thecamonas trahens ATCC 50062]|uniref:Solute carrier family 35 n=1 Tax=Thecamonas trahens ATCC 50062 TaxID=461836 RepID=A0A0L0D3S4_THETB|nr:solute carrier family 35 [Thecamonas trahens ATCC 50062]KNC46885.1 solute carrier family 35 [Thecamonas trahens ATCC 50062]|eukprot:XP_013760158.1 solute carrier family 35 [Thecamonas trahens ATCC 50062]